MGKITSKIARAVTTQIGGTYKKAPSSASADSDGTGTAPTSPSRSKITGGGATPKKPVLFQSQWARIKANDGAGGVILDRVGPSNQYWHHHKDIIRWQPGISVDEEDGPGDWQPDFDDVSSYVTHGHRQNDADEMCIGSLAQVFVVPPKAHNYGSTVPDRHSLHRLEIGIDRAHHYQDDKTHGPLHHIGHDTQGPFLGLKRAVLMFFWPTTMGGDDKWHWFTRTPTGRAPTTPRAPRGPTTPPPSPPGKTPPTGPGTGPTQPTGGGSGGPTTPSDNPYWPGGKAPPGTPSGPTNPYAPGGSQSGGGGWNVPFNHPIPVGSGGDPFYKGFGVVGAGAAVFAFKIGLQIGGVPPQVGAAEHVGEQSVYESGNVANREITERSTPPSRWALGTPSWSGTSEKPAATSRWALGTPMPADRGLLATTDTGTSIDWTESGVDGEVKTQTNYDGLREDLHLKANFDALNRLTERVRDLDKRARSEFSERQTVTVTAGTSTATATTTYAWAGSTAPEISVTAIGPYGVYVSAFSGAAGTQRQATIELTGVANADTELSVTWLYTVTRATAISVDAGV